jgi:hypothetical protein
MANRKWSLLATSILLASCSDPISGPRGEADLEALATAETLQTQSTLQWSQTLGDGSFMVMPYRLVADGAGEVFVVGTSSGPLNGLEFGATGQECFVGKFTDSGSLNWIHFLPSPFSEGTEYSCMHVDVLRGLSPDQVTIAASFNCSRCTVDEGFGLQFHSALSVVSKATGEVVSHRSIGNYIFYIVRRGIDGSVLATARKILSGSMPSFVMRFDSELRLEWEVELPGDPNANLNPVVLAQHPTSGLVAVGGDDVGNFRGFAVFLDGFDGSYLGEISPQTHSLTSIWGMEFSPETGNTDVYLSGWQREAPGVGRYTSALVKTTADGELLWRSEFDYDTGAQAGELRFDSKGNIWQSGSWGLNAGFVDGFLRSYDSDGLLLTDQTFGTSAQDWPWAIDIDGRDNVLILAYTWDAPYTAAVSSFGTRPSMNTPFGPRGAQGIGSLAASAGEVMTTIYKFAPAPTTPGKGKGNAGNPNGGGRGPDRDPPGKKPGKR